MALAGLRLNEAESSTFSNASYFQKKGMMKQVIRISASAASRNQLVFLRKNTLKTLFQ